MRNRFFRNYILLLLLIASHPLLAQKNLSKSREFSITDYGAVAELKKDNARAIQKAIDACSSAGGGKVIVPAGKVFMAGPFDLKSNIELVVEVNAGILANPDESVYKKSAFRDNKGEGTIWIGGENLKNVTISGSGFLDGNGISFMGAELEDSYVLKPFDVIDPRPHLLTIVGGQNIRIHDLIIRNSAYWTVHLIGCDDVAIDNITLLNSLKVRNSDGIDLDHCKNVRITNCYIESGDDCICLKNRREYEEFGPCENITVSNCTMTSRSCAIKIGSENMDRISHVVINNCIIKKSNRGIGIQNRDEGTVTDVIFSDIIIDSHLFSDVWWGKAEPIYVTAFRRANGNHKDANWRFPKGKTEGSVGNVSRIYFSNIKGVSENGIYVGAESSDKISDIVFDQVDLHINKTTDIKGGVYDRRPSKVEGLLMGSTSGFYLDNASNITIRNSSVKWGENKPEYFKHVLESHGVNNLKTINLEGEAAFPGKAEAIKKY
ncbi:glycoside hydrolase family 28 protein [Desertivirga arenae]|uniref:glycoside hydrolase family 28 protein n=1 Tax=Desertivirga arenae TaxID=2810309 RepID=UPI001A9595D1|nr:glycoside hydrolase family 28 protein [Pedobacter sp. SYSU D00823]